MTNTHGIDHHKLMMHPARVGLWKQSRMEWERVKGIFPIYMEVSPTGACNHRCVFCGLDYMKYRAVSLPADIMADRFHEMASCGVKSIMLAGEGEPLLHRQITDLITSAVNAGLDVAVTSNGVLMNAEFSDACLGLLKWIKISFNAGMPATYAALHRTKESDFFKVVQNLKDAVILRNRIRRPVTIGLQMLLLPENASEIEGLAKMARDDIGADYLVIKPYSQHLHSLTKQYYGITYETYLDMEERLSRLSTDNFSMIFRASAMKRSDAQKTYHRCLSTPVFWGYIQSDGSVYTCSAHLGDQRFRVGNLLEKPFREIWEGDARRDNFYFVKDHLDPTDCRINCRMDACNHYLWDLLHPDDHVNFI